MIRSPHAMTSQVNNAQSLIDSAFIHKSLESGFSFAKTESWATDLKTIADLDFGAQRLGFFGAEWNEEALIRTPTAVLIQIALGNGQVSVFASGPSQEPVDAALIALRIVIPEVNRDDPSKVLVTFWALGQHGPFSIRRQIDVPSWTEIKAGYASGIVPELSRTMHQFEPAHGGQLALWIGIPGTGKTWALRALAREWQDWCDVHYVVDPEKFFGMEAAYLMQVITGEQHYEDPDEEADARWRLLVFEDTGELISADAQERSGQGLSRFLNVVDGLIGQGMRVILLVTTNEEITKLHPAVARPGRCASNVMFSALSADEATKFIRSKGVDRSYSTPQTIAEVYAEIEAFTHSAGAKIGNKMGFVPPEIEEKVAVASNAANNGLPG